MGIGQWALSIGHFCQLPTQTQTQTQTSDRGRGGPYLLIRHGYLPSSLLLLLLLPTLCRSAPMNPSPFHGTISLGSSSSPLSRPAPPPPPHDHLPNSHHSSPSSSSSSSSSSALHRYHSAPSSMFSCLPQKDRPAHASRFLHPAALALGEYAAPLSADHRPLEDVKDQEGYVGLMGGHYVNMATTTTTDTTTPTTTTTTATTTTAGNNAFAPRPHLSAIFEHGDDEGPALVVRSNHLNPPDKILLTSSFLMPPSASPQPALIRQNSSSADLQSATITTDVDDTSLSMQLSCQRNSGSSGTRMFGLSSEGSGREMPAASSSYMGKPCFGDNNDGLIRHRSSPAGLFSAFSATSFSSSSGKSLLPRYLSADGITGRKELGLMPDDGVSEWTGASFTSEIQNIAGSAQRKRGREPDMKFFKPLQTTDLLNVASMNHGSQQSPDHCIVHGDDIVPADAVLFKARAKRGCATHPRSIAERVRRTKISERVKTLTDLVPNLDRQAHTADMLDEVVEYVKQLQRRLQELLEMARKCTCQTIEDTSLIMK